MTQHKVTFSDVAAGDTILIEIVSVAQQPPSPGKVPVSAFGFAVDGLSVAFTDQSTESPTTWSWSFGDGSSSPEQNPTHVYAADGTYAVSLVASNANGPDITAALKSVTVAKVVEPEPPVEGNILGVDFANRPRANEAWNRMLAASKGDIATTLTDTGGANNGEFLAAAFVAAATGDAALKAKVVASARKALEGPTSRTLEQARNLAPIAIGLDAIGDHTLDGLLRAARDKKVESQGSVIDCQKKRPNNWGTCSGLARLAVSAHLDDVQDTEAAIVVFKGWLGDRVAYAGFTYDDSGKWQADPAAMVGINKKGPNKKDNKGIDVDGVLPDDQRRNAAFPSYSCENYVQQALGEVVGTAMIVRAIEDPDVFTWSDGAIKRAFQNLIAHGCEATGDDGWMYAAAQFLGLTMKHSGFAPGKSFGFFDWLYG